MVSGLEDRGLAAELRGWVLWADGDARTIRWLELPGQTGGTIRLKADVTHLLGVDGERRLIYIDWKHERSRLRAIPIDGGGPVTIHEFEGEVSSAELDPTCHWLIDDEGGSLEYRELRSSGELSTPSPIPTSDSCSEGRFKVRWLVPGVSVVYEALGRFQTPCEFRVVDLPERNERTIATLVAYLVAVDSERAEILLRQGDPQRGDLTLLRCGLQGEAVQPRTPPPGLLFSILGISRDGIFVYEGLPTQGTTPRSLGWGLTWPRSAWTLKIGDPESGKFQTLVPDYDDLDEVPEPIAVLR